MKVFEIKTKSGREFKVICANVSQIDRLIDNTNIYSKKDKIISIDCILNGIHSINMFEKISKMEF